MLSALVIATRFIELGIEQGDPVTPMKLQKLIYLAHGIHLARFDVPLISDDVEAWDYGPVIKTVYDIFKQWGNRAITEVPEIEFRIGKVVFASHLDMLTDDVNKTINMAWAIAKDLSGVQLSTWSHSMGSPWQRTYSAGTNKKIRRDIIRDYFRDTMKIKEEA